MLNRYCSMACVRATPCRFGQDCKTPKCPFLHAGEEEKKTYFLTLLSCFLLEFEELKVCVIFLKSRGFCFQKCAKRQFHKHPSLLQRYFDFVYAYNVCCFLNFFVCLFIEAESLLTSFFSRSPHISNLSACSRLPPLPQYHKFMP